MNGVRKTRDVFSVLALFPLGVMALGYGIFKRDLAKVHVDLPVLNVPLFVGEMLLIYTLLLLALRYLVLRSWPKVSDWSCFLAIFYMGWLIFKVAGGYYHWGPLALRHAALFYYPIFFIVGFVFYERSVFRQAVIVFLMALIVAVFFKGCCDRYWTIMLGFLGAILILKVHDMRVRIALGVLLLLTVRYLFIVDVPRMMFIANLCSLSLVLVAAFCFLKISARLKAIIGCVFIILVSLAFYKYFILGESGRVFISPAKVAYEFKQMDAEVQSKLKGYKMDDMKADLYHDSAKDVNLPYKKTKKIDTLTIQHKEGSLVNSTTYHANSQDQLVRIDDESTKHGFDEDQDNSGGEAPIEWQSVNNILFRLFIWRDMFNDWAVHKPILGMDFGKPFRSISLEAERWAESEWGRDGWVDTHNSYFHILYRAGIVGIVLVGFVWFQLARYIMVAFKSRSWEMVLLGAILLNWLVAANFLSILEFPYTAIPIWALAGLAWGYAFKHNES